MKQAIRPRVAVHKFSSCDGCQVSILNLGEKLIDLAQLVDIVHFAEAGMYDEEARVDIAFVEGSVSTPHELERIHKVREQSGYVITIGACATSGGLQALRNLNDKDAWMADVYASPEYIETLATSTAVSDHIKVDLELWGCPVTSGQIVAAVKSLLLGVRPEQDMDRVCLECKRKQNVCVMVSQGAPCMGPVTRSGCDALCPSVGRDCYACFGPTENPRTEAHVARLKANGLDAEAIAKRYLFINNNAPAFKLEGLKWKEKVDG